MVKGHKPILASTLLIIFLLSGMAASRSASQDVSSERGDSVAAAYRDGFAAFRKRDFAGAAIAFKKAYEVNPKDDITVYFVAGAYALAGDKENAIEWLSKLAELRTCFTPSPTTFAKLAASEEFKAVLQTIAARRPHPRKSATAFTIPEKDLIPEGIAYDPGEKAFYLSSLRKRKIVRITPGTAGRRDVIEDFTAEGQDGLYCVLGMKVDPERRILWAISSAEPFMKGYSKEDDGKAALFAYDLRTRKLIKSFTPDPSRRHLLNDLAINANGDLFLTDSRSGEIFTLARGNDQLAVLITAGKLDIPNGIAISDDGSTLFIASIPQGVYRFDLRTKQLARLAYPQGISLGGIDGLYFYKKSLIGVLNMVNGGRVARFYLNPSLDRVMRAEIIECNNPLFDDPTTGAIAGDWLYYIANSQYESAFNEDGAIRPLDKLHDVIILKARL